MRKARACYQLLLLAITQAAVVLIYSLSVIRYSIMSCRSPLVKRFPRHLDGDTAARETTS